jgi:hypothetical protein
LADSPKAEPTTRDASKANRIRFTRPPLLTSGVVGEERFLTCD